MDDLIERLQVMAGSDMVPMEKVMKLLLEAASALEAAREDGAEAKQNGYELGLLAAAREDTARLDWLDTQRGDDVQGSYPEEPKLVGHYWSIDGQCTDVRTAIDAARKEAHNG